MGDKVQLVRLDNGMEGTVKLTRLHRLGAADRQPSRHDGALLPVLCRLTLSRQAYRLWLYFRFPLTLRMVEKMLPARGILVSHEMIRRSPASAPEGLAVPAWDLRAFWGMLGCSGFAF